MLKHILRLAVGIQVAALLSACSTISQSSNDKLPIAESAAEWDGTQFVLEAATKTNYWVSADGVSWERHEGQWPSGSRQLTPSEDLPQRLVDDGFESGDLVTKDPLIQFTAHEYWAVNNGELVTSVDGATWEVATEFDGSQALQVIANSGGDIAVIVADDYLTPNTESQRIVISHDGGKTWTDPIKVDETTNTLAWLTNVGPLGAVYDVGTDPAALRIASDSPKINDLLRADRAAGGGSIALGEDRILVTVDGRFPDGGTGDQYRSKVYNTSGELLTTIEPYK